MPTYQFWVEGSHTFPPTTQIVKIEAPEEWEVQEVADVAIDTAIRMCGGNLNYWSWTLYRAECIEIDASGRLVVTNMQKLIELLNNR